MIRAIKDFFIENGIWLLLGIALIFGISILFLRTATKSRICSTKVLLGRARKSFN